MQARRAFYAGLNGALAMAVLVGLVPFTLLPQNLGLIIGSMILREVSLAAWAIGLIVHLAVGGATALGYALVFERALHRSGWGEGLALGLLQAVMVGPLLALLPLIHPLIPDVLPAPGMYLSATGRLGTIAFFASHAIYGVVVGSIYADLPLPVRPRTTDIGI